MKNRKPISLIGALVVVGLILFLVAIIIPLRSPPYMLARRLVCGTNLKGMANALNVYAFDYRDEYPVQGAGTHAWGPTTTDWDKPKKDWTKTKGTLTVASSLYLLVREADVGVKSFLCLVGDQQPFVNETGHDMVELWDFGPNPGDHQSYSYHYPYGKFPPDGTSNPGNAIMADRSPWFDKKLTHSSIKNTTAETFAGKVSLINFLDDTNWWNRRIGNSQPHDREGQNVLFNDGHVEFAKRPDVGMEFDNIFTIGGKTEKKKRRGIPPTSKNIDSADKEDSLLVNER